MFDSAARKLIIFAELLTFLQKENSFFEIAEQIRL